MSRIDQALERARRGGSATITAGVAPTDAPADSLFEEAWTLDPAPLLPHLDDDLPREAPPRRGPSIVAATSTAHSEIRPDMLEKTVSTNGASAVAVEQYRRLTAKLHQAQVERGVKRLMVISAVANEGKTLTSVNIALTLSRSHKRRVLLVDTDLRRPSIHAAFQIPGAPGLREAALEPLGAPAPVQRLDDQLAVLPAGQPTTDPIQTLSSDRTREIITQAGNEYDWVIIDTAPLGMLPDANVLADLVDGAILVISAGRTPHDLVLKAVRLIGRQKIVGVVLNSVDPDDVSAAQYYAHYYTRD